MESRDGGKQEFDEEFSDKQFYKQAFSTVMLKNDAIIHTMKYSCGRNTYHYYIG